MTTEDPQATSRYFSSRTAHLVKSYVKSWRARTTTTTDAVSITTDAQVRGVSHRQATQKSIETCPSAPTESIHLFPGWAVRRCDDEDKDKFNLHVHISGYATTQRASRGQRALLRVAKGFASLNKLAESHNEKSFPSPGPNSSHEPKEEEFVKRLNESYEQSIDITEAETPEPTGNGADSLDEPLRTDLSDLLHRWHTNIEQRLQLFLEHSMLASRKVQLELFASQHHPTNGSATSHSAGHLQLITRESISTGEDGAFKRDFVIRWDQICHHSVTGYKCGEQIKEHELILRAKVLPPNFEAGMHRNIKIEELVIPITNAPIRVISDIDDTIKFSDILGGARAIFRNVFVHDLKDTIIPGMGEWYTNMWKRGVQFHYVSNGPLQLLPLVKAFLQTSDLPPGSIRLRSYAARSIFNDLLTPPADRKRDGLDKIFEAFPESKFILIGDTGEQDLELYAQIAKLHPDRVLAILVRDVEARGEAIQDPTGKDWGRNPALRRSSEASSRNASRSNSFLPSFREKFRHMPSLSTSTADEDPSSARDLSNTNSYVPEYEGSPNTSNLGKNRPIHLQTSSKSSWISSTSPDKLLSSPVATSVPSQRVYEESSPTSSNEQAKSNETSTWQESGERDVERVLAEEPSLSQSPESFSVLRSNMDPGAESNSRPASRGITFRPSAETTLTRTKSASSSIHPSLPSRPYGRRYRTADDATPRPRTPRRDTAASGGSESGSNDPLTPTSGASLTSSKRRGTSDSEKKLQERVWRARVEVPEGIILRIFRHPADCIEVEELLKRGGL